MQSDLELLRVYARDRSEAAFAELVRRNVNMIYAAALRQMRDPHLAEDIVQSVFTDLARKAPQLTSHPALVCWMFKSVQFAAGKTKRDYVRRKSREMEASHMNRTLSEPETNWSDVWPLLDRLLAQLSSTDQTAVALRFFKGMSFAEVASSLGTTEDNARRRTGRALDKLETLLRRHGVKSSLGALTLALEAQASVVAPAGLALQVSTVAVLGGGAGGVTVLDGAWKLLTTAKGAIVVGTAVIILGVGTIVAYVAHREGGSSGDGLISVGSSAPDSASHGVDSPLQNRSKSSDAVLDAPAKATKAKRKQTDTPDAKAVRQNARQEARRSARTREAAMERLQPLFQKLDLSPEKREALLQLVVNHHEAGMDFAVANAKAGFDVSADQDLYADWNVAERADFSQRVKELLGESGYAAYEENDLAYRQSAVVEHLQKRLALINDVLSPEQSSQLLGLLQQNRQFKVSSDIIKQSRAFLSEAQVKELVVEHERQAAGVERRAVINAIHRNIEPKK